LGAAAPGLESDLIAALATAPGAGAVGVVRLSGEGLADCLSKVFSSWRALIRKPRTMVLGRLSDPAEGLVLDKALAVFFPGPGSFTGEDCAEIHCHGGATAPRLALEAVLSAGARLARPGEFTQRAFLNGRMSLDQAEAVAELVASQSRAEAALAARHLEGALGGKIAPLSEALKAALADLTAALDFLDEEWTEADNDSLLSRLSEISAGLAEAAALGREGRIYREGVRVVLAGPPNAGKSSLFNALLGRDRAMVSSRPGTTRDYLEAGATWSGIRVELVDTAGLRKDGADELESEGQALSMRELARADVAIWLSDLSIPEGPEPPDLDGPGLLAIGSKADLATRAPSGALVVSALTGQGLESLKEAVLSLAGVKAGPGPEVAPNLRQCRALEEALERVKTAVEALESKMAPDIAAIELRDALSALGLITGETLTEDLLEEVFSRFCLGK
jgi:tRNA modification GTPase